MSKPILIAIVLSFLGFQSALARIGTDQGNGGDISSAEFVEIGHKVVDLLRSNNTKDVDIAKLQKAVNETKVESTDQNLDLNGIPKDAINYPAQKRIVFNRKHWGAMDAGEKPTLALHEYLGIIGVNDSSYAISRKTLGSFKYDTSYGIDCNFDEGIGNINMGIDEQAGMDTVLLSINLKDAPGTVGSALRPVGEFSQMIRDGNFQMAFQGETEGQNSYLVALKANGNPYGMSGSFAMEGQVIAVSCTIKKFDIPDNE